MGKFILLTYPFFMLKELCSISSLSYMYILALSLDLKCNSYVACSKCTL